jgi:hypothetical protein
MNIYMYISFFFQFCEIKNLVNFSTKMIKISQIYNR